jgi:hypothetical protein
MNLANAARLYLGAPSEHRAAVVRDHVDRLLDATNEPTPAELADWDWMRPMLRVRIMDEETARPVLETAVLGEVAPGLKRMLYLDRLKTVSSVEKAWVESSSRRVDDAWAAGLANVWSSEQWSTFPLGDPLSRVVAVASEGFFGATHALLLDRHVKPGEASRGFLFAVPTAHFALYHIIVDGRSLIHAMNELVRIGCSMYHDGPHSISTNVFWVRDGGITTIPAGLDRGTLFIRPPDDLAGHILTLPASAPEGADRPNT